MSKITSVKDLNALADGLVDFFGSFAFHNPDSINGPFGTFNLTIAGDKAFGTVNINTLFEIGAKCNLAYTGTATADGSTGYINVVAAGTGTIESGLDTDKRAFTSEIKIALAPDRSTGTITVVKFWDAPLPFTKNSNAQ